MTTLIRIERFPYEEPHHVELLVKVVFGDQAASIHYYTHASDLTELGQAFSSFRSSDAKGYTYEIGSEDPADRFAYYLRVRLYRITFSGETGVEIRFALRPLEDIEPLRPVGSGKVSGSTPKICASKTLTTPPAGPPRSTVHRASQTGRWCERRC